MTDQQLTEEQVVETTTQDGSVSEAEVQQPGQVEEEAQTVETGTTQNNEAEEAPKDNAAWAAMRVENKQLKQIAEAVTQDQEYFNRLQEVNRYTPQAPQPIQVTEEAEYPQTIQAINQANILARNANQEIIQLKTQLREREDKEAETAYPELKTDPIFQQLVAEKKLTSTFLGRPRTTIEIAEEVRKILGKREQEISAKVEQQTTQRMIEKQVATAEARTTTSGGSSSTSDDELRHMVRKGDRNARIEQAKGLIADLDF